MAQANLGELRAHARLLSMPTRSGYHRGQQVCEESQLLGGSPSRLHGHRCDFENHPISQEPRSIEWGSCVLSSLAYGNALIKSICLVPAPQARRWCVAATDRYNRQLVDIILRDGRDAGAVLVWEGRRQAVVQSGEAIATPTRTVGAGVRPSPVSPSRR